MARVKRAVNAHKKRRVILERAKGYRGQRSRLYRKAKEQLLHSFVYSYGDRRKRKGDFRRLWIQRINAASRANGLTYNRLIQGLKKAETAPAKAEKSEAAAAENTEAPAGAVLVVDGQPAPEGFTIKGNAESNKYHVPGSTWYEQTAAQYWFDSVASAKAAGYEPAGGEARQKIAE